MNKEQVYSYIKEHPGVTGSEIAAAFPIEDVLYGSYKPVSFAIAALRKEGKLQDCPRCEHCGQSVSRGRRNVRLYVK